MSWLFSRVLVEEYLEDICLDGEPFVRSSGNLTQLAYCAPDKITVFSRLSRFGMTYKPLTESHGEELLTLCLEAFHAKTLVLPEKEQELPENEAECGEKWRALLAKYDLNTRSWRTAQCSLFEDLELSLETWPKWGLMRDGECWEQTPLVPLTDETESGLWLTPTVMDGLPPRNPKALERQYQKNRKGRTTHSTLREQVVYPPPKELWPTPTVCGNYNRKGLSKTSGDGLATAVAKWPTPVARMWKDSGSPSEFKRNEVPLAAQVGGTLNPDWVEWLMNWPIKWSNLNEFNKQEFQRWQKASAKAIQDIGQMQTMWWDSDPSQIPLGQQLIPRVNQLIVARVDRLKAIGNGQVPLCAATAWRILTKGIL